MRLKALSTGLAAISLAFGLAVAPAGFAHGVNASNPPHSARQTTQSRQAQPHRVQNKTTYSNKSSAHSSWWNNQSRSSSNCAKSFSQLDQCSV